MLRIYDVHGKLLNHIKAMYAKNLAMLELKEGIMSISELIVV